MLRILLACSLLALAVGHSWLGCADYRGDVDYYDDSKCFAYPRYWQAKRSGFLAPQPKGYEMGGDSGYNYQPGLPCNLPMATPNWKNAYTTDYPHAVYEQGKTYCLAWPTKNHVAATCTNAFIPDTKMTIYRTNANPTSDPTDQQTFSVNEVVHNFGVHSNGQVDCLGYQRSPKFCDNTDKAMATGCIKIPSNLPLGNYVFQWYWIFNPGSPYTTCWDAEVVASGAGRGGGGLTGVSSVTDNLGGSGTTCQQKWAEADAAAGFTVTPPSTTTPPATGGDPVTPTLPPTPTTPSTTESVSFVSSPAQITGTSGSKFMVALKVMSSARNMVVVDVLNLDVLNVDASPVVWYGKGNTSIGVVAAPVTVNLEVTLYKDAPITTGYILRAWLVTEANYYADPSMAWTKEIDRRDQAVVVGSSLIGQQTGSGSSTGAPCNTDKKYTGGDIAGTFFGTLLILSIIFGLVYWFKLRK